RPTSCDACGAVQRGRGSLSARGRASLQVWSPPSPLPFLGEGRLRSEFREERVAICYLIPSRAEQEQTMWLGNFDTLEAPVHKGSQGAPHKPVVADWLYFPHPTYRQGVLLRFSRTIPVTLHLPPPIPPADGQAAVELPVRP